MFFGLFSIFPWCHFGVFAGLSDIIKSIDILNSCSAHWVLIQWRWATNFLLCDTASDVCLLIHRDWNKIKSYSVVKILKCCHSRHTWRGPWRKRLSGKESTCASGVFEHLSPTQQKVTSVTHVFIFY